MLSLNEIGYIGYDINIFLSVPKLLLFSTPNAFVFYYHLKFKYLCISPEEFPMSFWI